jgi:hypothetical protein
MTNARVRADRLAELLRKERFAMADFLVSLAEFDRLRGWTELGYCSLFDFLHREMGLSKGAAHYRKTAAGLVQRFPEIVEPLRDGRLCITSIIHLAKVLTPENRHQVLPRFFQRSAREAMAVAAALQPATAVPQRDVVTPVRPTSGLDESANDVPSPSAAQRGLPVQSIEPNAVPREAQAEAPAAPVAPVPLLPKPARRDSAEPLTEDLSRLHITVSRRFLEKLESARIALSHVCPGASAEQILEAGLNLVLERHARRKGLVKKPRQSTRSAKPATLTAAVKREVWIRDGGQCQWPLDAGGICGSTQRVEFDHNPARALGGLSTAENVRLLCRFHNDLAARRVFGNGWMDQFTGRDAERRPAFTPGPSTSHLEQLDRGPDVTLSTSTEHLTSPP